jgi:hypothetical protein
VSSFFAGFGMTPVQRYLRMKVLHPFSVRGFRGVIHNPPVPSSAPSITVTVEDEEGWGAGSCFTAKSQMYLLWVLEKLDCRMWVSHHAMGSVLFVADGELSEAFVELGPRIKQGEQFTFTAQGPDALSALDACRVFFEAAPEERRRIYRRYYRRGAA